jgi:hypothetical protein
VQNSLFVWLAKVMDVFLKISSLSEAVKQTSQVYDENSASIIFVAKK